MLVTKLSISDSKNRADQMSETGSFLLSLGKVEPYFFYSKSLQYIKNFCIHVMQLQLAPFLAFHIKKRRRTYRTVSSVCGSAGACTVSDDAWKWVRVGIKDD